MTSSASSAQETTVASVETDEQSAQRLADAVGESFTADEVAVSLVDIGPRPGQRAGFGRWRVSVFFGSAIDQARIRNLVKVAAGTAMADALTFEHVAEKDWVAESLAGLKPVAAGRFVVHGAHDRGAALPNRIGIEIEAALAFGTGHHGTTRGCLLAFDGLIKLSSKRRPNVSRHPEVAAKRPSKDAGRGVRAVARRGSLCSHLRVTGPHILDLGTGSGVLAIAAARALHRRVLAVDIDAVAVRAARDNARWNRAGALVEVVRADGPTAAAIRSRAPYDLVFANILLRPLQRFAVPLTRIVTPHGRLVLSGLLAAQANAALAAYHAFRLERRIVLEGWTTLVLKRAGQARRVVARKARRS
ncbi:MAG: 50S ribosomal protein L11 methyltransferase [Xanthobacteraceae bacterium]